MRRLLLMSGSQVYGTGYLDHCEAEIRRLFEGVERVLFVPWALFDLDAYAETARRRLDEMGLAVDSIHETADPVAAIESAQGVFIGGGNTFRLVKALHEHRVVAPLRRRVAEGVPYMGTSAGSNVACPTLKTTNDMPIVSPPTFEALALVPFQLNPHYLDPDPASTHMGETRDTRLREFHEENETPVIAIREGAMLVVETDTVELLGKSGGKLFLRGAEPRECAPGERLDFLLHERAEGGATP